MINIQQKQVISIQDWDSFVVKTYGKPYCFQQQNGCQERGNFNITIPSSDNDFENTTIPEEINGDEMGVSFAAWLARDPSILYKCLIPCIFILFCFQDCTIKNNRYANFNFQVYLSNTSRKKSLYFFHRK